MREFVNGAEIIARAAIRAGCDFFAGYPITPATQILRHMVSELPKIGGTAIQAEDEIASMGFCIGAAMTGARVMTATSGPGISLYSENIGLAIMGEVPMVIVNCQRMGPATGGATTTAQGDIQFLRWVTSGGYPIIALSPTNTADCYGLTLRAFDLAERFRTPVFLAADKEVVQTRTAVDIEDYEDTPVRQRLSAPKQMQYTPYRFEPISNVPVMSPFGGPHLVRFTGSTHNEHGYLSKKSSDVERLNRHLSVKIDDHIDEIAHIWADHEEGAETVFVSYGITAGAVLDAVNTARAIGRRVSALIIYSLWPVPEKQILQIIDRAARIFVVELNMGQYRREIERLAVDEQEVLGINRVDGELITPTEILENAGIS